MASLLELAWTTHASARRTDVLEAAAEAAARLVPDGFALIWLALVVIIATLASLLPARSAVRLTVRDVLAYEG